MILLEQKKKSPILRMEITNDVDFETSILIAGH